MTSNQDLTKRLAAMLREKVALADKIESSIPGLTFNRSYDQHGKVNWIDFGGAVPWQAEGTYNGKEFYARFRGNRGAMTVYTGEAWESEVILSSVFDGWVDTGSEDDWYAGSIDGDETISFLQRLIDGLEPVSEANPTFQTILSGEIQTLIDRMEPDKES